MRPARAIRRRAPVGLMVEVGTAYSPSATASRTSSSGCRRVTHGVPPSLRPRGPHRNRARIGARDCSREKSRRGLTGCSARALRALERRDGAPRWSGVRVELGETHLATGNTAAALALFEQAAKDDRPAVRSRARAGAINAHRLAGRLDLALAEARGAPAPPPSAATAPDGSPEHIDEESFADAGGHRPAAHRTERVRARVAVLRARIGSRRPGAAHLDPRARTRATPARPHPGGMALPGAARRDPSLTARQTARERARMGRPQPSRNTARARPRCTCPLRSPANPQRGVPLQSATAFASPPTAG